MTKTRKFLKRLIPVLMASLVALAVPIASDAEGGDPIAICLELSAFDGTNTSGSSGNTLIRVDGSATTSGGALRLTSNTNSQAGTAVRRNQIKLTDGFSTYFQFKLSNGSNPPADGLAFIVYKSDTPQIGAYGEGLGYQGIGNSYIVEFDTYYNSNQFDPNAYHFAIMKDGNPSHASQPSATYSSIYNSTINVWVDYNGSNGSLTVVCGTSTNRGDSGNQTMTRNVGTALVGQNVFVGFSASTGGSYEYHDVYKWYFKNSYVSGGLSSTAGTYTQGASTVGITLDNGSSPTAANIRLYDATGAAMSSTADIYIDDVVKASNVAIGTSGYDYSLSSLTKGSHTLRVVASGGSSNFKTFTLAAGMPNITLHPSAKTVSVGSTATFSAAATSPDGGSISYQWQVNSGSGWSNITNATGSSYTTGAAVISDNGKQFRCALTNTTDGQTATAYTDAATLSVNRIAGTISITGDPSKVYDGTAVADPGVSTNSDGTLSYLYYTDSGGSPGSQIAKPSGAGTYWVRASVAQSSTYTQASDTKQFSVSRKPIANDVEAGALLSYSLAPKTYNGAQQPVSVAAASGVAGLGAVTVYYEGTGDTVYAKSAAAPADAGTYTVSVDIAQGTNYGAYAGLTLGSYAIQRANMTGVSASGYSGTYDGAAHGIALSGAPSGSSIAYRTASSGEYTLPAAPTFVAAGTYTVYYQITNANYNDYTGSEQVVIGKKALSDAMLGDITGTFTYDGTAKTPSVTVSDGSPGVITGSDYTVSYADNINAGTATFTVTATADGNYSGSASKTFTINKKALSSSMIANIPALTYNGQAQTPALTVADGSPNAIVGADYTVSYADNTDAGTATATITATANGNYTGSASKTFTISKKALSDAMIGGIGSLTYNGAEQKPALSVSDGSPSIIEASDYMVSYSNNINAGTAIATITATADGNYAGAASRAFVINKKPLAESMVSTLGDVTYTGAEQKPVPTVADGDPSIIAMTDYTVIYTNNVNAGTAAATVTATAEGNYAGSISRTFTINKKALTADMIGAIPSATYSGAEQRPAINVRDGNPSAIKPSDYTVAYSGNVNAGTATVTVTAAGNGNYTGSVSRQFTIEPKTLSAAMVAPILAVTYDGTAHAPVPVLSDGGIVIPASNYTVSYANNTNAGTATVTVAARPGGNYSGTISVGFTISKRPLEAGMISAISDQAYTGEPIEPSFTVTDGARGRLGSSDYRASFANNTNAGTASLTITATSGGNYSGSATRMFRIAAVAIGGKVSVPIGAKAGESISADVSGVTPAAAKSSLTYQWFRDGAAIAGATTSAYAVTEADAGKALTVTVSGSGNFTGSVKSGGVSVALPETQESGTGTGESPIRAQAPEFGADGGVTVGGSVNLPEGSYEAEISFRPADGGDWQTVSGEVTAGGGLSAALDGLVPGETYEYRITVTVDGETYTTTGTFRAPEAGSVATGSISGTVTDNTGLGTGITVTIEAGNTVIASMTGLANGSTFEFVSVPDGVYNLVANNGSYRVTKIVTVRDGKAVDNVNMTIEKKQSVVQVATVGTPDVAVGGLNELFGNADIYTSEDEQAVAAGGTVEIRLVAEAQEQADLGQDETEQILEAANGQTIGMYLDLTLVKTVYDSAGNELDQTRLTDVGTLIEVVIPMPENLRGISNLAIYRLHEGVAEPIPVGAQNANAYGEYCEIGEDYITLHVSRFSVYAVGYGGLTSVGACTIHWWLLAILIIVIAAGSVLARRNAKRINEAKGGTEHGRVLD